jgi:hypothetical protein
MDAERNAQDVLAADGQFFHDGKQEAMPVAGRRDIVELQ